MQVTIYVDPPALLFMERFLDDSLLFERERNAELILDSWDIFPRDRWMQVQVTYDEYFRLMNIEDGIGGNSPD